MKKQVWTILVSLLIVSMALTACGGQQAAPTQEQAAETAAPAAQGDKIIIGAALCLTGIQAPLDEPALRGAQLAVDVINQKGGVLGKQVELIELDGKSDPVTVGNVAVQLIQQGANAIITPSDFDFGGPAAREAQKAGIVAISPAASSPLFGSKTLGDKQFTMSMWNTTMGAAAAEFAYNELGYRSVYVVTDTFIDYTKSLSRYFIVAFKGLGGEVMFEDTYTQGAQDFSAQLARIQALEKKPDFLYISSYMPDLGMIIRTIREAGIDLPIVGGDSYDDPGLFQAVGAEYGNDIYFTTHSWVSPDTSPEMKAFLEAWKAKYGKDPDAMWVVTGWDVVNILTKAMEIAGSTDGAAMAKAMEDNEWNLLTGKLDWSDAASGHETNKESAIVVLKAGVPSFWGWYRPAVIPPP
ncbi:MAG: ABC transporter substrate-binding protein [Chloroflexota bacterium]